MDDMNRIVDRLAENEIKYRVKTNNLTGTAGHRGGVGIRVEYANEYRVFVHKRDYEKAMFLMRR